jgi:Tfp pilus assembly protein PilF
MKKLMGAALRTGGAWQYLRFWAGVIGFLLFSGCALANSQRLLVTDENAPGEDWPVAEILHQGEAYYQFILSYGYQLRHTIDEDYAQAVSALQQALRYEPDSALLHTELARLLLQSGDANTALQACQKAVGLAPEYPPAQLLLGRLQARLQHPDAAKVAFQKAIALQPDDPEAYLELSAVLMEAGQPDEAFETLQAFCNGSLTRCAASMHSVVCMRKKATTPKPNRTSSGLWNNSPALSGPSAFWARSMSYKRIIQMPWTSTAVPCS